MDTQDYLSESQIETLDGYCPRIVDAARRNIRPKSESESEEFRMAGIRYTEAIIKKVDVPRDNIVSWLKRYVKPDDSNVLEKAIEIVDEAFANLGKL